MNSWKTANKLFIWLRSHFNKPTVCKVCGHPSGYWAHWQAIHASGGFEQIEIADERFHSFKTD